jgi:hypothetical protein
MQTPTEKILNSLRFVSRLAFVAAVVVAIVQVGALVVAILLPDASISLGGTGLKLADLYQMHPAHYFLLACLVVVAAGLQVGVWAKLKNMLSLINLQHPFSGKIALMLQQVGLLLFGIWAMELLSQVYYYYLKVSIGKVPLGLWVSFDFEWDFTYLFNAGIVFIISQVFKRGIELQQESELTV